MIKNNLNRKALLAGNSDHRSLFHPNRTQGFFSLASVTARLVPIPSPQERSIPALLRDHPESKQPRHPFLTPEGSKADKHSFRHMRALIGSAGHLNRQEETFGPRYGWNDKASVVFHRSDERTVF
jgi:hypothetical protein